MAQQLYIPSIGDHLELAEDWTFQLYRESRNEEAGFKWGLWGTQWEFEHKEVGVRHTLPAGTRLSISRIYIRQGAKDYDSVTFFAIGDRKLSARFWVKLADANQMIFTKVQSPAQRRAEDNIAQRYHLRLARSPLGHDYGEDAVYISAAHELAPALVSTYSWGMFGKRKITFSNYPTTDLPSVAKSYKTLTGLKKFLRPTVAALIELVHPVNISADMLPHARSSSLVRIKNVSVHSPDGSTCDLLAFLKEHFDDIPPWVTEVSP